MGEEKEQPKSQSQKPGRKTLTRREFLKLSALTAAGALAGCAPATAPTKKPTEETPAPTPPPSEIRQPTFGERLKLRFPEAKTQTVDHGI